jgi:hypothetical protein
LIYSLVFYVRRANDHPPCEASGIRVSLLSAKTRNSVRSGSPRGFQPSYTSAAVEAVDELHATPLVSCCLAVQWGHANIEQVPEALRTGLRPSLDHLGGPTPYPRSHGPNRQRRSR